MSRLFGELRQMGYVVPDVKAAMDYWANACGIGPWFYADKLPLTSFTYDGKHYDDIHLSIGLANCGAMQIELIQQRSDHPSMYADFLAANPRGGLQHWSSWPENYDELYQRALEHGFVAGQEGDAPRGRFVYFRNESHPGTIVEMSHATPERRRIFDAVRAAAVGWDGSDPIRDNWPSA